MPATRTQIYLTVEQRRRLDAQMRREGASLAELIRRAVDRYLEREAPDAEPALDGTFGCAPNFQAPSRDEWEPRG